MESKIALALAVKLKTLFERPDKPDKFLSFPLGLGFTYEALDFMRDEGSLPAEKIRVQQTRRNQFARQVNLIPADSAKFDADGSTFLWHEYKKVLDQATVAESDLTEAEKIKLKEAEDYLTDVVKLEDGQEIVVYSQAYKQYLHYQTLAYNAEKTYLDEQTSALNSTDPQVKQQWTNSREKELTARYQQALNDWLILGYKDKIEAATETKRRYSQRNPTLYFDSYRKDFNVCLAPADTDNPLPTYTTFFMPSDIFDPKIQWNKVHLHKDEIKVLAQSASPELKNIFLATEGTGNIEAASLEYTEIYLAKDWFKPEVFGSRYWKMPPHSEVVSDGQTPRRGKVPAYISSLVVARNVEVTYKKDAPPPTTEEKIRVFKIPPNLGMAWKLACHFQ